MRIVAINGSPKGKDGNTNVIVEHLFKGAQEAGAETRNIFLAEKEINHCRGCHICWTRGPGQCVISDDMPEVLAMMGSADVILFASPVYFGNISGMLKTFMDRMTMIGSPHTAAGTKGEGHAAAGTRENVPEAGPQEATPPAAPTAQAAPKLMMVSSCGFSDRGEFEVTSLWINKVAQKMNMELIGEIYATNGKAFHTSPEALDSKISDYLQHVEQGGKEIAAAMNLSAATKKALEQLI